MRHLVAVMDLGERLALSLIAADCNLFADLAFGANQRQAEPVVWLTLMPYLSSVVYDSSIYLEQKQLVSARALEPHRDLLRHSRQRMKLLADDRQSFDDILSSAAGLSELNSR